MRSLLPTIHKYLSERQFLQQATMLPFGYGLRETEPAHKEYARFPRVKLPRRPLPDLGMNEVLDKRSSDTSWKNEALSLETLGAILGTLKVRDDAKRPYPSGGGLYPIETYLVQDDHLFHYHPTEHCLEKLWTIDHNDTSRLLHNEEAGVPPCLILFTALWPRSTIKYGERSYRLATLEAGHMAQNISLAAAALNCSIRAHGTQVPGLLGEMLNLDEELEQLIYVLRLGPASDLLST